MFRVQCCGVLFWGVGTAPLVSKIFVLGILCFFCRIQEQFYINSHHKGIQSKDTDNTHKMSIVGQVFAERKRQEEDQQTRNKSKVNWNETGKRQGEKFNRNDRNRRRQKDTRKDTGNGIKDFDEDWVKNYRRNTGKDVKGKYLPTKNHRMEKTHIQQ